MQNTMSGIKPTPSISPNGKDAPIVGENSYRRTPMNKSMGKEELLERLEGFKNTKIASGIYTLQDKQAYTQLKAIVEQHFDEGDFETKAQAYEQGLKDGMQPDSEKAPTEEEMDAINPDALVELEKLRTTKIQLIKSHDPEAGAYYFKFSDKLQSIK